MANIQTGYLKTKNGVQLMTTVPYPIGAIYLSVDATDPSKLFGGQWEQLKDVFLLACGNSFSAGSTGGEKEHKLTTNELPRLYFKGHYGSTRNGASTLGWNLGDTDWNRYSIEDANGNPMGEQPHNNMPPYLAVYMWKRIA